VLADPISDAPWRRALSQILRFVAISVALLLTPFAVIRSKAYDVDPDIWWHIRVGDWIAEHHAVPRVSIFSQYIDRPWTAYSWAFELLVSGVHRMFGLPAIPGLLLSVEILISLTFLLSLSRISGSFWWTWAIGVAGIFAFQVNPLRPMAFTVLFFIVELLLIFEAERTGNDNLLYCLGPLFILWANFHIQFVYGIAVAALYVACRILLLTFKKSPDLSAISSSRLKLAGIGAVALLGSCIGPNGWLPYKVAVGLATQPFVFQIILEMHAMDFRFLGHYVELLLLMAACFAVGQSHSRDLFRPTLLAMTAFVSFRSARDMWFVAIAASFVIAEAVRLRANQRAETPTGNRNSKWKPPSYALATALAATISFAYGIRHGVNTPDMIREIDKVYPIRATEFVRDSHLQGPIYNSMNWGGFLIFNLRDLPVSIDPRTNIYGDELLARSIATTSGIKWQTDPVLARSNLVILERYVPLAADLVNDPAYRLVYQDQIATVFVKQPK
jgi:hypothetical protein